ncbi:DUF3052 family protein [Dokdonella sp.]|uniref:DUF3052 family protein n=1 Tax=Dokdonella sp. TaxID=2291710 RepID=UPI003528BA23
MSDRAIHGYSGKPLWQKLGLKPGLRILVLDCPMDYAELTGLGADSLDLVGRRARFDLAHAFTIKSRQLADRVRTLSTRLQANGVIWISWPKKSSGVPTDITEDTIREVALPLGLVDIKVCAIDATWSGLKLVWRKEHRARIRSTQHAQESQP